MSAAGQRGPVRVGNSSVNAAVMASMASSKAPPRSSKGGPKRSNSSLTCPAPTPTMTRPPDSTSSVENSLAVRKGWR